MRLALKVARKLTGRRFPRPGMSYLDQPVAEGFDPSRVVMLADQKRSRFLRYPPTVRLASVDVDEDELVLGVARGEESKAYRASVMAFHHIVNDTLNGSPVVITFCENCFSGVAFEAVVDGVALTFGVAAIYQGSLLMRDDQTRSLWTQVSGEAVVGSSVSKQLRPLPLQMARAADWQHLHPDTRTPDPRLTSPPRPVHPGKELGERWRASLPGWDRRLDPRTLVLGIRVAGHSRAYALDVERWGPRLYQDELGGVPLALLAPNGSWPLAYQRRLEGNGSVDLSLVGDRVVDETGSVWDGEGRATSGPRAGMSLRFLPSRVMEWYAWSAYYPGTDVTFPEAAG